MKCPHCSQRVPDGNLFCIKCGKPLTDTPAGTGKSGGDFPLWPFMTGFGLICLTCIVILIYLFFIRA